MVHIIIILKVIISGLDAERQACFCSLRVMCCEGQVSVQVNGQVSAELSSESRRLSWCCSCPCPTSRSRRPLPPQPIAARGPSRCPLSRDRHEPLGHWTCRPAVPPTDRTHRRRRLRIHTPIQPISRRGGAEPPVPGQGRGPSLGFLWRGAASPLPPAWDRVRGGAL